MVPRWAATFANGLFAGGRQHGQLRGSHGCAGGTAVAQDPGMRLTHMGVLAMFGCTGQIGPGVVDAVQTPPPGTMDPFASPSPNPNPMTAATTPTDPDTRLPP